jgi:2-polyprenyl-3-methyl-5-hydroxy-6-metoxy-1,4-benzoquinol methylase
LSKAQPTDSASTRRGDDPCLICGSLNHTTRFGATYRGSATEAGSYFLSHRTATAHGRVVRCRDCGFIFTSPRFSDSEYDEIYRKIQAPRTPDSAFEQAKAARFQRLGAVIRRFQAEPGQFLDFGCGDGAFLRTFGRSGGVGFEVGADGSRLEGGYEILNGSWAQIAGSPAAPAAHFDFVAAFDVLEHLPHVERDIALISKVLKPSGLLFATVPDIESLVSRAMGSRWSMLLLEHLWYFSRRTLTIMMARNGLEALHFQAAPFDAPVAHVATRLAQAFGMKGALLPGPLTKLVLPVPAGIMLGVFRKTA